LVLRSNISLFDALEKLPAPENCTQGDLRQLDKFLSISFLGQMLGLPTLCSVLEHFGVSNCAQIKLSKLIKKLSNSTIKKLFEFVFEQQLSIRLGELCQHDAEKSVWGDQPLVGVNKLGSFKEEYFPNSKQKIQADRLWERY
jgi:hypothetical protein